MMMSIALRFIPTLIEETDKIMSAQKARARILNPGICSAGPRRWCPFLCRCSSAPSAVPTSLPRPWSAAAIGGEGRTKLSELHYQTRGWVAYLTGAALLAVMIVLRHFGL